MKGVSNLADRLDAELNMRPQVREIADVLRF